MKLCQLKKYMYTTHIKMENGSVMMIRRILQCFVFKLDFFLKIIFCERPLK